MAAWAAGGCGLKAARCGCLLANLRQGSAVLPFASACFDVVVTLMVAVPLPAHTQSPPSPQSRCRCDAAQVLHHLPSPESTLAEVRRDQLPS